MGIKFDQGGSLRSGHINAWDYTEPGYKHKRGAKTTFFFTDLVPIKKKNVQLNEAVRSLILIE